MNLKRLLTRFVFSSIPVVEDSSKIKHCTDKRCQLCTEGYLKIADKILSPVGRLLVTIKYNFTCKSKNILDLLHGFVQYVTKTTWARPKISESA